MLNIYISEDVKTKTDRTISKIRRANTICDDCWINLFAPTEDEITDLIEKLDVPEEFIRNPAPESLASRILGAQENLCILLPREDALITLDRDDTCMTVYNPSETLLNRLRLLASAEGLFLWQP